MTWFDFFSQTSIFLGKDSGRCCKRGC